MAETHVISALTKKRAELLGEIKYYQELLKQSKDNLTHIDKTIKMFDENYNLKSIKPKRMYTERYFKNGEAKILVLDILRTSNRLNTDEIAEMIANNKGLVNDERFLKSILNTLKTQEKNGLIQQKNNLWEIKEYLNNKA